MYVFLIQSNLSKPNPFGTEEFVQYRQVFGFHRFKLHRHLVDMIVKSVWFRQVFDLLRVRVRQVFGLLRVQVYSGFSLDRFLVYSGFCLDRFHCTMFDNYCTD